MLKERTPGERKAYHEGFAAGLERAQRRTMEWKPIETAPNDSEFHLYGLHVVLKKTITFWECYYLSLDDDGELVTPNGDTFSDWHYSDFTHWLPLPPAPEPPK